MKKKNNQNEIPPTRQGKNSLKVALNITTVSNFNVLNESFYAFFSLLNKKKPAPG